MNSIHLYFKCYSYNAKSRYKHLEDIIYYILGILTDIIPTSHRSQHHTRHTYTIVLYYSDNDSIRVVYACEKSFIILYIFIM